MRCILLEYRIEIEKNVYELLSLVQEVTERKNTPWVLIGAYARIITYEIIHRMPPVRVTNDIDVGIMVENWETFEEIKNDLVRTRHFERDPKQLQRLIFHEDIPFDLIPFGQIENHASQIHWLPDGSIEMNVAGFSESYEYAATCILSDSLRIRVISPPCLLLIKLFAWHERNVSTLGKDASDIAYTFRHYQHVLGHEKLFDEYLDVMESVGFDVDLAIARILGMEVRSIVRENTRKLLLNLLDDTLQASEESPLVSDIVGADKLLSPEQAYNYLLQFQAGFKEGH